jgi:hypothetical protein
MYAYEKEAAAATKCQLHTLGETLHVATCQCVLVLQPLCIINGFLKYNYTGENSNSDSVKCVSVCLY